jgi:hypothetical protein
MDFLTLKERKKKVLNITRQNKNMKKESWNTLNLRKDGWKEAEVEDKG